MDAKSFNLSVQGASHIKKNKECQDASKSYYDDMCAIAIVCDGHGGDDYVRSAVGSKIASEVTLNNMKNFMYSVQAEEMKSGSKDLVKQLEASIINDWNEAIHAHFNENPFTDEEIEGISERAKKKYVEQNRIESAYGTTVIGVAMTDKFWIGIHIGDGKCVAVNPQGRFLQPIPWDEKCFLNATTSICDSNALENFRYFYSERLPIAVFVGSDGIDDCFKDNEQLNNLYRTVLYSFMTNNFDNAIDELYDYLPRLSLKGSGDDMSISAIIDIARLSEIPSVRDYDEQKERERVEAAKKEEAEKAEAERVRVEEERMRYKLERAKLRNQAICPNCGELVSKSAKYCEYCGNKLMTETEDIAEQEKQELEQESIHVSSEDMELLDSTEPEQIEQEESNITTAYDVGEEIDTSVKKIEVLLEDNQETGNNISTENNFEVADDISLENTDETYNHNDCEDSDF